MKVILANNYHYLRGGSERVVFNDSAALNGRGLTAIPFSAQHPQNIHTPFSQYFPKRDDYESATGVKSRICAAAALIDSRASARAFERLIDSTAPDLVHCHNIYGRLTTSILSVARRRMIPVVMSVHDYKIACPAYRMLRQGNPCSRCCDGNYARAIVHRCHRNSLAASAVYAAEAYFTHWTRRYADVAAFLCPSRFVQSILHSAGIPSDRTIYLPNALSPDKYTPQYQPGEYALYVGRLSGEKGLHTLLQALPAGVQLKIAGTGPIEFELREIVRLQALSTVHFEGHCNDQQLRKLYHGASIVILPSENYENAPMSILEAFACGKPVVATRIGGIPELVHDGITGWTFAPGNVAELHQLIAKVLSQPDAVMSAGRNARKTIESTFTQTRRTDSLLRIYKTALAIDTQTCENFAETTA